MKNIFDNHLYQSILMLHDVLNHKIILLLRYYRIIIFFISNYILFGLFLLIIDLIMGLLFFCTLIWMLSSLLGLAISYFLINLLFLKIFLAIMGFLMVIFLFFIVVIGFSVLDKVQFHIAFYRELFPLTIHHFYKDHILYFDYQLQWYQEPYNLYFQPMIKQDNILFVQILEPIQHLYEFSQNQNQIILSIFHLL